MRRFIRRGDRGFGSGQQRYSFGLQKPAVRSNTQHTHTAVCEKTRLGVSPTAADNTCKRAVEDFQDAAVS